MNVFLISSPLVEKPYKHQSMFWSDLGSAVGYEAIGLVNSSLHTVAVFAKNNPNDEKHGKPYEEKPAEIIQAATTETVHVTVETIPKDCPPAGTTESPEDFGKGVIFYMQDKKIVGILLWNVFNRISIARKVLMSEETFDDLNEVAKLFDIFEQQTQDKQA